jgi:serine/threonine protein kinase
MLSKEINILHMIGFHKHIVSLKEVLHAPQRVYMVTGEPSPLHKPFPMLESQIRIIISAGKSSRLRAVACTVLPHYTIDNVTRLSEFCDGGELVDRVSTHNVMSERTASRVIRQLCEALVHLHDQGVAHMDLKPENIVFKTRHGPRQHRCVGAKSRAFLFLHAYR